jgi:hypothetical protein
MTSDTLLNDSTAARLKTLHGNSKNAAFDLFKLAHELRDRHMVDGDYDEEFKGWYEENGLKAVCGKLPNFTKKAFAGSFLKRVEVLRPEAFSSLPESQSALYALACAKFDDSVLIDHLTNGRITQSLTAAGVRKLTRPVLNSTKVRTVDIRLRLDETMFGDKWSRDFIAEFIEELKDFLADKGVPADLVRYSPRK